MRPTMLDLISVEVNVDFQELKPRSTNGHMVLAARLRRRHAHCIVGRWIRLMEAVNRRCPVAIKLPPMQRQCVSAHFLPTMARPI
jgi:hypothetical protein